MPNDDTVCKRKPITDKLAKDAEAQLDRVLADKPDLADDLALVKTNLIQIANDPHKPK